MRKTISLFVWLILSSAISTILGDEATDALGQEKLEHLLSESKDSNGMIQIKGSDFEKYISKGPRPYYVIVVLTALISGNCSPCEQIAPEIKLLGKMIEDQRKISDNEDAQVFIIEADFQDNRNTFQKLGLSTAPMIVMVPPTKTKKEIPLSKFFKNIGLKYQYSLTSGREAAQIGEWIAKTAKITLNFGGSFEIPDLKYVFTGLIGILTISYFFRKYIDIIRRKMILYALVSIAGYAFVIGGGMFSVIRKTPWAHHEEGSLTYISHMSRYQFTVEGYLVGVANLVAGFGAFLYINGQRDGWEKDRNGKTITRWWARYWPIWLPFGLLIAGWYFLMWAYTKKNGHYNFGHVGMKG